MISINKTQARRFILDYQGLLPPRKLTGKEGILELFRRIGSIQYDPLNIVGTNPELVLQSRIADFTPAMLGEMLYTDRSLMDDWDKMMCIFPVEDRHYFHYRKLEDAHQTARRNTDHIKEVIPLVRKEIEERGPLSSIDLTFDKKVDWSWGPMRLAKVALDEMYYRGELIIHHKVNTRKVYDLAIRHLPAELIHAPDPHKTIEEYHDWHVLRRLRSLGMVWSRPGIWYGIYGARSKEIQASLQRLISLGKVMEARVEGVKYPMYLSTRDVPLLEGSNSKDSDVRQASIIAPLDNLLWDRELVKELFGFTYRWEVYKPEKDREYGYYVLPVLYGDRFVARFEPGRNKKTGAITIKNWWWEPEVAVTEEMESALRECFLQFAHFNARKKIDIQRNILRRERLEWLTSHSGKITPVL